MKDKKDIRDGIIGLAIGDAMGTPTEGIKRAELLKHPIVEMVPSIERGTEAGTWSDDTAMSLAEMDAITRKGIDYKAMADNFIDWVGNGKYSATGKVFGMGSTTMSALWRYQHEGYGIEECGINEESANGNGSLMRMLPLAYYFYYQKTPRDKMYEITCKTSALTHAHEISKLGCYIYIVFALELLKGNSKEEAYRHMQAHNYKRFDKDIIKYYDRLLNKSIARLHIEDIKSDGYIVDTLEASIWCFLKSSDYQECITATTNIGGDTDTIGAISGGLAGIYYGYKTFPNKWLNTLKKREYIEELCTKFQQKIK